MKENIKKKLFRLLFVSSITILFTHCNKFEQSTNPSSNIIRLNFQGIDEAIVNENKQSSVPNYSNDDIQRIVVPMTNDMAAIATLIPVKNSIKNQLIDKIGSSKSRELTSGTLFKILVYNDLKRLVAERDYVYKKFTVDDPNIDDVNLNFENLEIGKTYTFVVYSTNSKTSLPNLVDKTNLDNATLSEVSSEFMYFKQDILLQTGINYLNVILKHQFNEVSAEITLDQTGKLSGSKLTQMANPTVTSTFTSANVSLLNGKPSKYNGSNANGTELNVTIPSYGITDKVTTNNAFIISDGSDASFNISSLTINGFTKNLKIDGFKLTPGVRYILKLQIGCPCITEAQPSVNIDRTNHTTAYTSTYDYTDADFGAVLDIYEIDNSFNLKINEKPLYIGSIASSSTTTQTETNEIQFQGFNLYPLDDTYPNIEFEDGSRWGRSVNGTNEIWQFSGRSASKPIIRINITNDSKVTILASKNLDGGEPYYPLRLINEKTVTTTANNGASRYIRGRFNDQIEWKSTGNKIELSQKISSTTFFYGHITGKKIVDCQTLQ